MHSKGRIRVSLDHRLESSFFGVRYLSFELVSPKGWSIQLPEAAFFGRSEGAAVAEP
jgi:hypothetical protein